jgi:hypothetical protein
MVDTMADITMVAAALDNMLQVYVTAATTQPAR